MKKTFLIEDLECAHCAAKMEKAIKNIDGVTDARVNFVRSSLTVEAPDEIFDRVMKQAVMECRKIEPDAEIVL
ncbi:MAG: cation transporter [Clostridia bacterium]|nr:cation transporter [Clostridia bacterium]